MRNGLGWQSSLIEGRSSARERLPLGHMWTAPASQGAFRLWIRSLASICRPFGAPIANAGQDGFRDGSSDQSDGFEEAMAEYGIPRIDDRSITPSTHHLVSSGIGSAPFSAVFRCTAKLQLPALRGLLPVHVGFAAHHALPCDTGDLVGEGRRDQLGGLRLSI